MHDFAARVHAVIDTLDNIQKHQLLRLLIEGVRVTGWQVQIRLPSHSTCRHPNHPVLAVVDIQIADRDRELRHPDVLRELLATFIHDGG